MKSINHSREDKCGADVDIHLNAIETFYDAEEIRNKRPIGERSIRRFPSIVGNLITSAMLILLTPDRGPKPVRILSFFHNT